MIDAPTLIWGATNWLAAVCLMAGVLLVLILWGYWRSGASAGVRLLAGSLKFIGILILALCLLEPLFSGTRARPGANQFVVLFDNSQSMTLRDRDSRETRGQQLQSLTTRPSSWLERLGQDFDLRQYAFDTQLRAIADADVVKLDGGASNLGASLERLLRRYQGRPLAGVVLLTDGNSTDPDVVERFLSQASAAKGAGAVRVPPIYPVLLGKENPASDINLERIAVSQTNFEDAPVTLAAQVTASGYRGRTIVAKLVNEAGKEVDQQTLSVNEDGQPLTIRFRLRPEQPGISFYRINVAAEGEQPKPGQPEPTAEATLANNSRLVAVDRGQGPYRVLYVCGRPNWEFKFLQRAIQGDDQVQLFGLLRIAKKEPKFNYLGHVGEQANPLFRGFDTKNKEELEQYDQPVLVRIGATDENELRSGFPQAPEDLYKFHAVILDDLESEFFTQDQMLLLKEFVRQRGGGLLMLGGQESFKNGKYDRTPIGDLLPVYIDDAPVLPANARVRMALTREGWLEPWIRLRPEEVAERQRLTGMPSFQTINTVRGIKPGATVLASADVEGGASIPALVEQRFGRGRAAALLIGDLWRWDLRRPADSASDLEKAWRQTVRWLVSQVPQRVEVALGPPRQTDEAGSAIRIDTRVRDEKYAPLDNAAVTVRVTGPDGKPLDLTAEASAREPGLYEALYVPRQSGAYRTQVTALTPDGNTVAQVHAGWTSDPSADEFKELRPNRALLDRIAKTTGGQTINAAELDAFVSTLPTRHAEITEPYIRPMWHQTWVFLLAILCLTAEWGIRRWRGLP